MGARLIPSWRCLHCEAVTDSARSWSPTQQLLECPAEGMLRWGIVLPAPTAVPDRLLSALGVPGHLLSQHYDFLPLLCQHLVVWELNMCSDLVAMPLCAAPLSCYYGFFKSCYFTLCKRSRFPPGTVRELPFLLMVRVRLCAELQVALARQKHH